MEAYPPFLKMRITCIMLILGNLNASLSVIIFTVSIML